MFFRSIALCLLTASASFPSIPQPNAINVSSKTFQIGDRGINIPSPGDFVELGENRRHLLEIAVPTQNRLVAGFVLKKDASRIGSKFDDLLEQTAMIQVPRQVEFVTCTPNDFQNLVKTFEKTIGRSTRGITKNAEEEFNRRLKNLAPGKEGLSLGTPIQLGCFFSNPNAFGFGMLVSGKMGRRSSKVVTGSTILRIKGRIIFAYLNTTYKDDETIRKTRSQTQAWAEAILKANM